MPKISQDIKTKNIQLETRVAFNPIKQHLLTLCELFENFFDIIASPSTCVEVNATELASFCLCSINFDLSVVLQVTFVANHYDWYLITKLCSELAHPFLHPLERVQICYVIHNYGPYGEQKRFKVKIRLTKRKNESISIKKQETFSKRVVFCN